MKINERVWKGIGVSMSVGALVGLAACGSMQMPNMSTQSLWGDDSEQAAAADGGSGVRVPDAGAQPMSQSQFQALKSQVDGAAMSQKKLSTVEEAGQSAWFSAAQVGELAAMIDMKADRVRLVESVAARILDLDNPGALTSQLTFADERSSAESIMANALSARQQEQARIAEANRIAEERRAAEQREAEEQARRDQEAAQAQQVSEPTQSSQTSSQNSSSSSAYCCLGQKYNACDSGTAAAACLGWGQCTMRCMMNNESGCDTKCTDEYPAIRGCQADASKDHLCSK